MVVSELTFLLGLANVVYLVLYPIGLPEGCVEDGREQNVGCSKKVLGVLFRWADEVLSIDKVTTCLK